jgi:hypothetical protein
MADYTLLTIEDPGEVKLGDTILPGTYQSMQVKRALRMDEQEVPGRSGASKQPLGFSDAEISLTLALHTDYGIDGQPVWTAQEKKAEIVALFQQQDTLARPFVYPIASEDLNPWGIVQVVFRELVTVDDNQSDLIVVSLNFVEFKPVELVQAEDRRPTPELTDGAWITAEGQGATFINEFGDATTVQGDVDSWMAIERWQKPEPVKLSAALHMASYPGFDDELPRYLQH